MYIESVSDSCDEKLFQQSGKTDILRAPYYLIMLTTLKYFAFQLSGTGSD